MPLFFFDFDDGEIHLDDEGSQFASRDAACLEAKNALPEITKFAIPATDGTRTFTMSVRDEAGETIYKATVAFTETR